MPKRERRKWAWQLLYDCTMTTAAGVLRLGIPLAVLLLAAGCGGTSVSHGGDDDAAGTSGLSGKGGAGGTGGTSAGGTGGDAGGSKGGTLAGGTGGDAGGSKGGTFAGGSGGNAGNPAGGTFAGGSGGDAGNTTGGTTNVGGSSSGAGGTGGMTSCSPGARCNVEGATCSTSSCCSCQSTCRNGVWQNLVCPPCAAPICPALPPADGDMCDMCQVPSEGCSWDQCAVDGPRSEGHCDGLHWVITSSSCAPNGCCTKDTDCAPGSHCLSGGKCVPAGTAGSCWVDADCPSSELCSGVFACACGTNCPNADASGTCVPKGMGCCAGNDCPAESTCVKGVCKVIYPTNTSCWTDHDCSPGGQCFGASVCACGTSCLVADSPGMCVFPL